MRVLRTSNRRSRVESGHRLSLLSPHATFHKSSTGYGEWDREPQSLTANRGEALTASLNYRLCCAFSPAGGGVCGAPPPSSPAPASHSDACHCRRSRSPWTAASHHQREQAGAAARLAQFFPGAASRERRPASWHTQALLLPMPSRSPPTRAVDEHETATTARRPRPSCGRPHDGNARATAPSPAMPSSADKATARSHTAPPDRSSGPRPAMTPRSSQPGARSAAGTEARAAPPHQDAHCPLHRAVASKSCNWRPCRAPTASPARKVPAVRAQMRSCLIRSRRT